MRRYFGSAQKAVSTLPPCPCGCGRSVKPGNKYGAPGCAIRLKSGRGGYMRTISLAPKKKPARPSTPPRRGSSWWCGLSREAFSAELGNRQFSGSKAT